MLEFARIAISFAVRFGRTRRAKILWTTIAVIFGCLPGQVFSETQDARARLEKADAMFRERCKTAGEKIYKTVENVEGVYLLKLRPKEMNYGDQFRLDDPYGRDLRGDGYIGSFLRGEFQATHIGTPRAGSPPRGGFLYVEVIDSSDGKRYRYTGRIDEPWKYDSSYSKTYKRFVLDRIPAPSAQPHYGITYDDISTREDREYWIAGSSLKVIDLKTNQVIAERIGYMVDRGQGNKSGGRSPWLYAADNACPPFSSRNGSGAQPYQTLDFVEKVLKPKSEK